MPVKAVIFDLDDTLVVEVASARETFRAVCRLAEERCGVAADALYPVVRRHMDALWRASPEYDYCAEIGIGSWEGLWAPFEGDEPHIAALRGFAPGYRVRTWAAALAEFGVEDAALAAELAAAFVRDREGRNDLLPGAREALDRVKARFRIGMVTNGLPGLQRIKLRNAGLAEDFPEDVLVVSGDHGFGKPDPRLFEMALAKLGVAPDEAVMVGNSLRSDIGGAKAAGIRSVWINLDGETPAAERRPDIEVRSITDVPPALE